MSKPSEITPRAVSVLPDYETDESHPVPFWRRMLTLRGLSLLLLLGIAGGGAWHWGPSIYRELKARRAASLIEEGQEALREGNPARAGEKFRSAFSLAPGDERVFVPLLVLNALSGDLDAGKKIKARFHEGVADTGEILALAEVALRSGDTSTAREAIQALPSGSGPEEVFRSNYLWAQILAMEGRSTEAFRRLQAARAPAHLDGEKNMLLGRLGLTLRLTPEKITGFFEAASQDPGPVGANALRHLLRLEPPPPKPAVSRWAKALRNHPSRERDDIRLSVDRQLASGHFDPVGLSRDLAQEAATAPASSLPDLAFELSRLGAPDLALACVPEAGQDGRAVLARADALARLGRLDDARRALDASGALVDPALKNLMSALFDIADLEDPSAHWSYFRGALPTAGSEALREAVRLLAGRPFPEAERAVLEILLERKLLTSAELDRLLALLPPATPARIKRAVFTRAAELLPQSERAAACMIYYALLDGDPPSALADRARELFSRHPNSAFAASALAVARLKTGDPEGASRLFAGFTPKVGETPREVAIAYLATLKAAGQTAAAQVAMPLLGRGNLSAEEARLLARMNDKSLQSKDRAELSGSAETAQNIPMEWLEGRFIEQESAGGGRQ